MQEEGQSPLDNFQNYIPKIVSLCALTCAVEKEGGTLYSKKFKKLDFFTDNFQTYDNDVYDNYWRCISMKKSIEHCQHFFGNPSLEVYP